MSDDRNTPLSLIPGQTQLDVMAESLRHFKRNVDMLIEYHQSNARLIRARYLAYVENGFTEAQALELCKHA